MSEEAVRLRAALLQNPGDVNQWKVYADWLEENNDPGSDGIRDLAQCLESEEGEIARYLHLTSSAEASADLKHAKFCRHITRAGEEKVEEAVEALLDEYALDILDSDEFSSASDITYARDWALDEVVIESIRWKEGACVVRVSYSASGEHDEKKMFFGNTIKGTAKAMIDAAENVVFEDITAEVRRDGEDEQEHQEDGEWE